MALALEFLGAIVIIVHSCSMEPKQGHDYAIRKLFAPSPVRDESKNQAEDAHFSA